MKSRLIDLIYEAPIEAEPWCSFLHAYRCALRSGSALLMFRTPNDPGEMTDVADAEWHTHAMRSVYYRQYAALNPLRYELMEQGRLYSFADFLPDEEFHRSAYFREYCEPLQIHHALVAFVGEVQGLRAWLNVSRSRESGDYSARERRLAIALLPHLHRALRIYSLLEQQRLQSLAYRRASDSMNLATLLLDERGHVESMNDAAGKLLCRRSDIFIREQRLFLSRDQDQHRLRSATEELLGGNETADYRAIAIVSGTRTTLSILMRRVPRGGADLRHTRPAVIVYLQEPTAPPVSTNRADIVSILFGLTPSESRLAVMLAGGANVPELTSSLHITEQTVRTYMKRIFQKTGVSRQSDLVRLVLTSVAGLGD